MVSSHGFRWDLRVWQPKNKRRSWEVHWILTCDLETQKITLGSGEEPHQNTIGTKYKGILLNTESFLMPSSLWGLFTTRQPFCSVVPVHMEFQTLQLEFCLAAAQQYLCHAFEDHPCIAILVQAAVDHVFHLGKRWKTMGRLRCHTTQPMRDEDRWQFSYLKGLWKVIAKSKRL